TLPIHRANRTKRLIKRITIACHSLAVVLESGREGDWPGGKIEQITIEMEIGQWQLELAGVMQCNINPANRGFSIATEESKERIKRCGWVRIQQRLPQSRPAHIACRQILPLIPGITETGFPVPGLEIVPEFCHLTLEPKVKESIPVSELFASRPGVVNATKPNPSGYGKTSSVRKEIWNSRIRDGER